jgi:O-antigen ligase
MSPLSLAAWTVAFFLASVLFSHTVALRLLLLLLGAVFIIAAIAKDRRSIGTLPPVWPFFALWAAWAALSFFWSLDPARSEKEFVNEIVYTALALWICHIGAQARDAARIILPVFACAAALVCAVALYYFPRGPETYGVGWHGGPGDHSSALLTLMPCVLMAGWYAGRANWSRELRLFTAALGVLILASAYTTLNRTVWLGFAAQLLILGALLLTRRSASVDLRSKAIGAAVALAVIAGGAVMTLQVQAEREATGAARSLEKDPRLALWPQVLERIEQRPLTGYGFGRGMLRAGLKKDLGEGNLWHAHNLFLDVTVQLGLPGLVLLLLLLGATLREGWRMARDQDPFVMACGIALIAVVAGMLIRNMTDVLWVRQNSLLYWGVIGVLLAWGRPRPPASA